MRGTAEAMVEALVVVDVEAGRLLVMEGTKRLESSPSSLDELQVVAPEQFIDGDPALDQIKISLRYESSGRFSSNQIFPLLMDWITSCLPASARYAKTEYPALHVRNDQSPGPSLFRECPGGQILQSNPLNPGWVITRDFSSNLWTNSIRHLGTLTRTSPGAIKTRPAKKSPEYNNSRESV